MPVRVLVAEDNYLVREAVTRLLDSHPDTEVVATAEDLDSLLAAVETASPDVVVTDIRMPPTGSDEGVRAAVQLRTTHPALGVVVLSQYVEPAYALELLEGGSERRAYLLKERVSDVDQLVRAVSEVAAGGSVIDPKVVEALVEARSRRRDSPLVHLTPRESEVLAEMAQGRNNASVGAALGLSERVESALERRLSATIMSRAHKPEIRTVKKGRYLVRQGDAGDDLFLLLDGVVSVQVDGEPIAELGPGVLLGERPASRAACAPRRSRRARSSGSRWPGRTTSTATRSSSCASTTTWKTADPGAPGVACAWCGSRPGTSTR
jgi:DNA-binding NarL/FixJ family response regulator